VASQYLEHFPGLVIEGARQVGKSTLATMIAGDDVVVANLDDSSTRAAAQEDPTGFVAQAGHRTLLIDEVQRLPELTLAVKAAIDSDRRPGRFILTGSSSLLRVRGLADSLAGRVARLTLYGFSRGEAGGTAEDFANAFATDPAAIVGYQSSATRRHYAEILAVGAYPEVSETPSRIRTAWLDSYIENIVGRDLPDLRRKIDPARAMAILRTLAGRPAAELVKAKLAEETSVPAGTITGYLDLLHDVGLVASIPPWTPNIAKREIGRPKSFVVDTALAMRLGRTTPEQLADIRYGEALGATLEGFVAAEMLRQRGWSSRDYQLFHWRDSDAGEVDLVLEFDDGSVVGIEVKSASSYSAKQFRGLAHLRDALGERFRAGLVLGTATSGYRFADRLYGAPIDALWQFDTSRQAP
jgi:predicted AAA+ superfamily ATPase